MVSHTQSDSQGVSRLPAVKKIAVVGFGNVGTGVVDLLLRGVPNMQLAKIVEKQPDKAGMSDVSPDYFTTDPAEVIDDPAIDVLVEVTNSAEAARTLILEALRNGKDVVTSNKAMLAQHAAEVFDLALKSGRYVGFRGTFVGCHSLIHDLHQARLAEKGASKVRAILNGTCNYILSSMAREGKSFEDALREAQEKGYAETDPSDDIDGLDTARKISFLLCILHDTYRAPDCFPVNGIRDVMMQDVEYAKELGYRIKLLGIAEQVDDLTYVSVHPALVPEKSLLGSVEGENNAIEIEDQFGLKSGLIAPGAGRYPTAVAVIKDLIDIANNSRPLMPITANEINLIDTGETSSQWYLRITVVDQPGVLAQISSIFAEHSISISAVIQKQASMADSVPIVLTTHEAKERHLLSAVSKVDKLSVVRARTQVIRMMGP